MTSTLKDIDEAIEMDDLDLRNLMMSQKGASLIRDALHLYKEAKDGEIKIPKTWPESGWYKNAAAFCDLIQATGGFWCMDTPLKYLNLRIDTRTGHFVILNNDRAKDINSERVLKAMREWVAECGFNTENERAFLPRTQTECPDSAYDRGYEDGLEAGKYDAEEARPPVSEADVECAMRKIEKELLEKETYQTRACYSLFDKTKERLIRHLTPKNEGGK